MKNKHLLKKMMIGLIVMLGLVLGLTHMSPVYADSSYKTLTVDEENKAKYADSEGKVASQFEWFKHDFTYNGEKATLLYRLFIPKGEKGENYPLVMNLHGSGGMGSDNTKQMDTRATGWAEDS